MRSSARVALILVMALAAIACGPAPASDKHASWTTRSYYVANAGHAAARNLGCQNGDKQGRTTLFFGAPAGVGGGYGATLWGAPNQTTAQIAAIAREFATGYAFCRQSPGYRLLIGIGTSNSSIDGRTDTWLRNHGRAWSAMVRSLSDWAEAHLPSYVRFYGAWDAEPSWSSFAKADAWMHGYDGAGARPLHANNSADGCPQTSAANGACNNGWNQRRLWHLSWEHGPALPFPQIYATSGANARQWHMISLYAHRNHGRAMYFYGVMSQRAACGQVANGCAGIDSGPDRSYDMLLGELWSREETRQLEMPGMTDIRWHS